MGAVSTVLSLCSAVEVGSVGCWVAMIVDVELVWEDGGKIDGW